MTRVRRWFQFHLDNALSGGAAAVAAILALTTLLLVMACGLIIVVGGIVNSDGESLSFLEAGWLSLMRTLDPGTMGDDVGWGFRVTSLIATLGGILVVSSLIGVITTSLDARLSELRRGRGQLDLRNHTVVLGWSQGIDALVSELAVANENQHKPAVVILSQRDAVAMRDDLSSVANRTKHQRLYCRTGNTASAEALTSINAEAARSIVVMHGDGPTADAEAIRTALAVINGFPNYRGQVVTQLSDRDLAETLSESTRNRALAVTSRDVIAKVTAQACRFRGMARVYEELLDFEGDEIYVQHEPALVGATFAQSVLSYRTSMPIGIQRADGVIELCPEWDRVVAADESIVAISEDDDTVVVERVAAPVVVDESTSTFELNPMHILIVGWNPFAVALVETLDANLPSGSTLAFCQVGESADELHDVVASLSRVEARVELEAALREVVVSRKFDNILLLCGREATVVEDDSRNLLRLVELRRVLAQPGCPSANATVVTELRDVADVAIAGSTGDDFVVSERLTSLMLAQLSENSDLAQVFETFFEAGGADIVMVPAVEITPPTADTFGEIVRSAMPHGLVIGVCAENAEARLNLVRSERVPRGPDLRLVVLRRHDDNGSRSEMLRNASSAIEGHQQEKEEGDINGVLE